MNIGKLLGIVKSIFFKSTKLAEVDISQKDEQLLEQALHQHKIIGTDSSLTEVVLVYIYILAQGNVEAVEKGKVAVSQSNLIPPSVRNNILHTTSKLIFKAQSVPGPTRLCRVPFYPLRDEDSWTSRFLNIDSATPSRQSFGIDEIGDDPILAVGPWLSTSDTTKTGPYTMVTRKVEFGAYRLVGLEIAAHNGARYIGAVDDGAAATGSVTITGTPAAATGTVEATGPTAVAASGDLNIIGTGANATGSIEFSTAPTAATGSIEIANDGDPAEVRFRLNGSEAAASAVINLAPAAQSGQADIYFQNGTAATGSFIFPSTNWTSGESVTLTNGDGTRGVAIITETYVAGTDFSIGASYAITLSNLRSAINSTSAAFTADYPSLNTITITQQVRGTFGNNVNGGSISTTKGFSTTVQLNGGVDAYQIGSTITVRDLSGNDRNLLCVHGGVSPLSPGEFNTNGDATIVKNNFGIALLPLISPGGTLAITSPSGNQVRLTFDPGYLPGTFVTENSTVNSPVVRNPSDGASPPFYAQLPYGFDTMDTDTEIAITDVTGTTYTFAPEPAGTTVPVAPNRVAFTTTADTLATESNLASAINASAGQFSASTVTKDVTITLDDPGRKGNGIALAYQTISGSPFNIYGPRDSATIFSQFDTSFSGGVSPVGNGEVFRLQDASGTNRNFNANNVASTANTFQSNGSMAETATAIETMLTLSGLFNFSLVTSNPPTEVIWDITQTDPGTVGNGQAGSNSRRLK